MKTETVNYEVVVIKIKELLRCGEKLTVRKVLNLTGGSSSKIMAYINRWHDEQKLVTQNTIANEEHVDKMHHAIEISGDLATAKTKIALLESNLASLDKENNLANKTINKLEQMLSDSGYKLDEVLARCHRLREEFDEEKAQHKASILARSVLQAQYDKCIYKLIELYNK